MGWAGGAHGGARRAGQAHGGPGLRRRRQLRCAAAHALSGGAGRGAGRAACIAGRGPAQEGGRPEGGRRAGLAGRLLRCASCGLPTHPKLPTQSHSKQQQKKAAAHNPQHAPDSFSTSTVCRPSARPASAAAHSTLRNVQRSMPRKMAALSGCAISWKASSGHSGSSALACGEAAARARGVVSGRLTTPRKAAGGGRRVGGPQSARLSVLACLKRTGCPRGASGAPAHRPHGACCPAPSRRGQTAPSHALRRGPQP